MSLNAQDLEQIEIIVRRVVGAKHEANEAAYFPLMTVAQFACAIEYHPDTVREKIRVGAIPPKLVFGIPYKIVPAALELFGVTRQVARTRLEAHNLWTGTSPSAGYQGPSVAAVGTIYGA